MQFVELGLQRSSFAGSSEGAAGYARLSDGLLDSISASVPYAGCLQPADFRRAVATFQRKLREAPDRRTFDAEVHGCLDLCRRQLERVRRHSVDCESGLIEIIEVLTAAVDAMAGRSSAFDARVLGESDRLGRVVRLDDVAELKRQVIEHVSALRQAVGERKREEESSRTRLSTRVKSLQQRLTEAEIAAAVDGLTGVGNRRQFDASLNRVVATSLETRRPFALALVDVDNFKLVNDVHGHQVGDRVLVALAQTLVRGVRKSDVVTRYGGDEFGVLLTDTGASNAAKRLSAIVKEVADRDFTYEGGTARVRFTISVGVAEYCDGEEVAALVGKVDSALYEAKRAGKNRVVAHPTGASSVSLTA